jgi:hypothetical protein
MDRLPADPAVWMRAATEWSRSAALPMFVRTEGGPIRLAVEGARGRYVLRLVVQLNEEPSVKVAYGR